MVLLLFFFLILTGALMFLVMLYHSDFSMRFLDIEISSSYVVCKHPFMLYSLPICLSNEGQKKFYCVVRQNFIYQ